MESIAQLQAELPALLNPTAAPARVAAYLDELAAQCERVEANSNDYPKQTISAEVWRDGYQIVNTARALAEWLDYCRRHQYRLDGAAQTAPLLDSA